MVITYKVNTRIEPHQLAEVFQGSGIRRPFDDLNRMKKMLDNANLLVTAWDGEKLVGVARALTDYSYCCYLSDLAVIKEYQHNDIGHELVSQIQNRIGDECVLILLSAPEVMEYYPRIGFSKVDNAFIVQRKK
jgi:N-acetylglutamate synthase-like GNAT family acetyltransferase